MILLDTDIVIDLLRKYPPAISWLNTLDEERIILPGFVLMELIQGTRNNVEQKKIEKELKSYGAIWPSSETCDKALSVFADCHLSHGLGILDALIGQMAVSLNLPLYTFNRRHYEALPGLQIIQPYVKTP